VVVMVLKTIQNNLINGHNKKGGIK
jgi:hypothetical protein